MAKVIVIDRAGIAPRSRALCTRQADVPGTAAFAPAGRITAAADANDRTTKARRRISI
jgi:hypothetical protein